MRFATEADAEHALQVARGKAIQAYAAIEESLCALCAALLRVPPDYAGVMFFKITSARARNRAVEDLIRKRCGTTYNLYWNSLIKLINQTDQKRNEIVHWQTSHENGYDGGVVYYEVQLTPPNIWDLKPTTPFMASEQIDEFSQQCDYISRSVTRFHTIVLEPGMVPASAERTAWLGIFQLAQAYPPPDTHPLSPNYTGP